MTRLLFTLKRYYLQISVVFAFRYRECRIPEICALYDRKFSTHMQGYASFSQSYKRELHECKGFKYKKGREEGSDIENVNTEYRLLQNTTIKYELR